MALRSGMSVACAVGSGQSDTNSIREFNIDASRTLLANLRYAQANSEWPGLTQNVLGDLQDNADWLFAPTVFPGIIPGFFQDKLTPNIGKTVTKEGAINIQTLAQILNLSEKICSRLLSDARHVAARTGRSDLETAVELFDELLLERIECLKMIWEETPEVDEMDLNDYQRLLVSFRTQAFRQREEENSSMLGSVLSQISALQRLVIDILPGASHAGNTGMLQENLKQYHLRSIRRAQRDLAVVLFKMSRADCLTLMEVWELLLWVKKRDRLDELTVLMLAVLFSAIQSIHLLSMDAAARNDFVRQFTLQILDFRGFGLDWIPLVLLLSWGLFLDDAQHNGVDVRLPVLPGGLHQKRKAAVIVRDLAIDNGAFGYLLSHVLPSDEKRAIWNAEAERAMLPLWTREEWPMVQDDQRRIVLTEVLNMVRGLVRSPSDIIGTLRRNERDAKQSGLRGGYGRDLNGPDEENQDQFPAFVELVIALYQELPTDSDFTLWEEESLLASLAEGKEVEQQELLARLLRAIGNGPEGSRLLSETLVAGRIDFPVDQIMIFALDIIQRLKPLQGEDFQRTSGLPPASLVPLPIPTGKEFELLRAYCLVLVRCIKWNSSLAMKIIEHSAISPISIMWQLVNRPMPSGAKAAALDALAAFSRAGVEQERFDICSIVWTEMEKICFAGQRGDGSAGPSRPLGMRTIRGLWLTRLEDQDKDDKGYTARQALIRLFAWMVKGDQSHESTIDSIAMDAALRRSMVDYVLVESASEVTSLAYEHASIPALQTMECVAMFAQYCMETFDPESIIHTSREDGVASAVPVLARCVRQAGYHVVGSILGNKDVFNIVTFAASLGHDKIASSLEGSRYCLERITQSFLMTVVLLLRTQRTYLEVLIPSLKSNAQLVAQLDVRAAQSFVSLERQLVHWPDRLAKIGTYTTGDSAQSLALLAIQFMDELAQTETYQGAVQSGHNTSSLLVQAVVSSQYSQVVFGGLVYRLDTVDGSSSSRLYSPSQRPLDHDLMADLDWSISAQQCGMAVLELLAKALRKSAQGPGFAHFLLGYVVEADGALVSLGELHREGAGTGLGGKSSVMPRTCMHVLVEQLLRGTPDLEDGKPEIHPEAFLWTTDVAYAVNALEIIALVCADQRTSEITVRFLRGQENFVPRLLAGLNPKMTPAKTNAPDGVLRYSDQADAHVSSTSLEAFLRFQSLANDIAALDLHSNASSSVYAKSLAALLLLSETPVELDGWDGMLPRLPYLLASLDASEVDFALTGEVERPSGISNTIDLAQHTREDSRGCTLYDLDSVRIALRVLLGRVKASGSMGPEEVEKDHRVLIRLLERSNVESRVGHATWSCFASWSRLASTLVCNYDIETPGDALALHGLALAALRELARESPSVAYKADMLSDVCMQVSSALVAWTGKLDKGSLDQKQHMLPLEHIVEAIGLAVRSILKETIPETARGGLYSTIIDHVNMGSACLTDSPKDELWGQLGRSLAGASEQLVGAIARDCLNAHEGWRILAYTLLTLLLDISGAEASSLEEKLDRNGFLQSMAHSLRSSNDVLKASIAWSGETTDSMVFDSKMEFLLQLASTEGGARRLARAGVLDLLARCDFIRAKPEMQDAEAQAVEETARSLSRYFGLVAPVLRLTLRMLQADHVNSYRGAVLLVAAQADAIGAIIGDNTSGLSPARLEVLLLLTSISDAIGLSADTKLVASQPGLKKVAEAMKALPGRFWSRSRWVPSLEATTDAEMAMEMTIDPLNGRSCFITRADSVVGEIQALLLRAFIGFSGQGDAFEPVLTVGGQLLERGTPKRAGPGVMSLTQATALLRERSDDLLAELDTVQVLVGKNVPDPVLTDGEVFDFAGTQPGFTSDLELSEVKALARTALSRAYEDSRSRVEVLLTIVEASLILIDRHIRFYAGKIASQAQKQYRFYDPKSSVGPSPDLIQGWKLEINSVLKELGPIFGGLMDSDLAVEGDGEEERLFLRALISSLADVQPFAVPLDHMR